LSKKGHKRATLDALFSQVVRERDDYVCQVCFRQFRDGGVDAAHHIGRSRGIVRWDLDNAITLCRTCHGEIDKHPLEHAEKIREWLGEERYEALKVKSRGLLKMTPKDREDLKNSLRNLLADLRRRRASGEMGRLECSLPGELT